MALIRARVSGDALPADIAGWSGIWQLYLEPRQATADGLYVIAHLGQSLDGKIAAANGQSCFVTGEDDLLHMPGGGACGWRRRRLLSTLPAWSGA